MVVSHEILNFFNASSRFTSAESAIKASIVGQKITMENDSKTLMEINVDGSSRKLQKKHENTYGNVDADIKDLLFSLSLNLPETNGINE